MRLVSDHQTAEGSEQQLHSLFEEHHRLILQTARRITGRQEDAEDVLQTVFLRLVKHANLSRLQDGGKAYLRRAAVNAALDIVRKRTLHPSVSMDLDSYDPLGSVAPGPEQILSASELGDWLRDALGRLNETAAEVFVLRYLEGCDNNEIARIVGTTPGTVAVTLHRTRNRLRTEIESFVGGLK